METIRIIGRGSRLSLLQLDLVKLRIEAAPPGIRVQVIARSSRGDALQDVPLHTVEGSDFFTGDIFQALESGEADIAVHSLKDMSSEHFFGNNRFAVVDRDDTRDVVILHADAEQKIRQGGELIIGTCSPRRELMATDFLRKALPQLHPSFSIGVKEIRGNVDTRLRKLDNREYDGIILATAGLNRLLRSDVDAAQIRPLLANKRLVVLPLIECVPAPCQGAIVAEAHHSNSRAIALLAAINDENALQDCVTEKKEAGRYGAGCLQRFGVTTLYYDNKRSTYAAGKDQQDISFSHWTGLPAFAKGARIFSTSDWMGRFFAYNYPADVPVMKEAIIYVANYKAAEAGPVIEQLRNKTVWASGTKTWLELAKKGIWVQGSADALGLETLLPVWRMPLLEIDVQQTAVLTHEHAAGEWQRKGWNAYGSYSTRAQGIPEAEQAVQNADLVFWTSHQQYRQLAHLLPDNVTHCCAFGETLNLLRAEGLDPLVFPTIKSFQQWRQTSTR